MEKGIEVIARYHYQQGYFVEVTTERSVLAGRDYWLCKKNSPRKVFMFSSKFKNEDQEVHQIIDHFGLHNIQVIDHVDEETMKGCPVPSLVFMVASASMEQEIEYLTKLNPQISIVIYTLDFGVAASISGIFEKYGIKDTEVIQISVARLNSKNSFEQQPAPWIITGKADC